MKPDLGASPANDYLGKVVRDMRPQDGREPAAHLSHMAWLAHTKTQSTRTVPNCSDTMVFWRSSHAFVSSSPGLREVHNLVSRNPWKRVSGHHHGRERGMWTMRQNLPAFNPASQLLQKVFVLPYLATVLFVVCQHVSIHLLLCSLPALPLTQRF